MQINFLGRELILYCSPGPLDENEVHWQGRDIWKLIGLYLLIFVASIFLMVAVGLVSPDDSLVAPRILEMATLIAVFIVHSRIGFWPDRTYFRTRWQDFRQHWKTGVIWGIALKIASFGLITITVVLAQLLGYSGTLEGNNPVSQLGLEQTFAWVLLSLDIILLAPLKEELLMRGILFGWLRRRVGIRRGMVLCALLFSLLHLNLLGGLAFFVSGLVFALLYERTGSLAPCMIAHGEGNLISVAITFILAVAGA